MVIRTVHACIVLSLFVPAAFSAAAGAATNRAAAHPRTWTLRDTIVVHGKKVGVREIAKRAIASGRAFYDKHRVVSYIVQNQMTSRIRNLIACSDTYDWYYSGGEAGSHVTRLATRDRFYKHTHSRWVKTDDTWDPKSNTKSVRYGLIDLLSIPVYLGDFDNYTIRLVNRRLEGDHVIFTITLEPQSDFVALPAGSIYVDSRGYRVVHATLHFRRSPLPLLLKNITHLSIYWSTTAHGEVVPSRIQARFDTHKLFHLLFKPIDTSWTVYDVRFSDRAQSQPPRDWFSRIAADSITARTLPPSTSPWVAQLSGQDFDAFKNTTYAPVREPEPPPANIPGSPADSTWRPGPSKMGLRFPTLHPSTDLTTYQRIDGAVIGAAFVLPAPDGIPSPLEAHVARATASRHWQYLARAQKTLHFGRWRVGARAEYRKQTRAFGSNQPRANAVRALAFGQDERDYLGYAGTRAELTLGRGAATLRLGGAANEQWGVRTRASFSAGGDLSAYNAPIDAGIEHAATAALSIKNRNARRRITVSGRLAGGALGGDFTYTRARVDGFTVLHLWGPNRMWVSGTFVNTGGSPPRQMLADAGGLSTVRGFGRRTGLGMRSASLRAEYPIPWDVFHASHIPLLRATRIQLIPWADWAQTWEGPRNRSLASTGLGIAPFTGILGSHAGVFRVDLVYPLHGVAARHVTAIVHFNFRTR